MDCAERLAYLAANLLHIYTVFRFARMFFHPARADKRPELGLFVSCCLLDCAGGVYLKNPYVAMAVRLVGNHKTGP